MIGTDGGFVVGCYEDPDGRRCPNPAAYEVKDTAYCGLRLLCVEHAAELRDQNDVEWIRTYRNEGAS